MSRREDNEMKDYTVLDVSVKRPSIVDPQNFGKALTDFVEFMESQYPATNFEVFDTAEDRYHALVEEPIKNPWLRCLTISLSNSVRRVKFVSAYSDIENDIYSFRIRLVMEEVEKQKLNALFGVFLPRVYDRKHKRFIWDEEEPYTKEPITTNIDIMAVDYVRKEPHYNEP